MIVRWRLYYDDGTTFSSEDGAPDEAPLDGVVGVGEEDDTGRRQTYWGADYYFWTGDGWAGGNIADLERWLRRVLPQLKYGRWAPQTLWQKVRAIIRHDWS